MSGTNVSICDGKYIIIQAPTGTTRVLRYGEEWRDVTGDNVIGGLAWELQEARDRIKRLEREIELFREHSDYGDVCLVEVILKGEELTRQENQNKQ